MSAEAIRTWFEGVLRDSGMIYGDHSALRTELGALLEPLRWRKWPEEKPAESGDFPVRPVASDYPVGYVASYEQDRDAWCDPANGDIAITHWRPLPEPPQTEESDARLRRVP